MTRKPLTQEQAIEFYTELQRRVQVGAYLELQHDGSYPEDDGTPESTTLESLDNLEKYAASAWQKEFCWHRGTQTWSLEPIEQWRQDSVDAARHKRNQFQAMQENEPESEADEPDRLYILGQEDVEQARHGYGESEA